MFESHRCIAHPSAHCVLDLFDPVKWLDNGGFQHILLLPSVQFSLIQLSIFDLTYFGREHRTADLYTEETRLLEVVIVFLSKQAL